MSARSEPAGSGASRRLGRLAAVFELLGVFFAAIVGQRAIAGALAMPGWKRTQAEMLAAGEIDFLVLSRLAAIELGLRYGVFLGLALGIGWWHRKRRLSRYGVTRAGHGWRQLAAIGVALWAVGKLPAALLTAADDHLPWIGRGPDHWAIFPPVWSAEFLLYMAVTSFVLVPIVEELAFRGYMLNRLREDFGDAGALALTVVFFTLVHTQYFKAEVHSLGLLAALAVYSLAAGWVVLRTGSLVPCIVAHALANLPVPPAEWSEEAILALTVAVVIVARRPLAVWSIDLFRRLRRPAALAGTALGLVVLLAGLGLVFVMQSRVTILAALFLAAGIAGDALERRHRRSGLRVS